MTNRLLTAASLGLNSLIVKPKRGFFPQSGGIMAITAQITISEIGHDELQITDHPVENGSVISDHAFVLPISLDIVCSWSNSSYSPSVIERAVGAVGAGIGGLAGVLASVIPTIGAVKSVQSVFNGDGPSQAKSVYDKMLKLQRARVPMDIYTGKRVYKDMLIKSITNRTTRESENSLILEISCKQVIIVKTSSVTVPINTEAQASPQKTNPTTNVGKKSIISSTKYKEVP